MVWSHPVSRTYSSSGEAVALLLDKGLQLLGENPAYWYPAHAFVACFVVQHNVVKITGGLGGDVYLRSHPRAGSTGKPTTSIKLVQDVIFSMHGALSLLPRSRAFMQVRQS